MALEVRLVRLACHVTEDDIGADEPYLNYNGERVFGPRSLNDGQTATLGVVRRMTGPAAVDLFDEDSPDRDDPLGRVTIFPHEAGLGQRFQEFRGDGAHYTLFYRVSQAPDDE